MKKRILLIISLLLTAMLMVFAFFGCDEKEPANQVEKPANQDQRETSKYVSQTMQVKEDGTFKILQLTDMHFINSEKTSSTSVEKSYTYRDEWAMTAATEVIRSAQPDLIIVTGDSIFTLDSISHFTGTNDNYAAFCKFANFIDSFEIPWSFLFGNHDEEGSLITDLGSVEAAKQCLADYMKSDALKYCIYDDGPSDINGIGNQIINIVNRDGSTNTPLVLFDSGSYLRGVYDEEDGHTYADQQKYEWVHDDQLDWYESAINDISRIEGKKVDSIVFQHIPFPAYGDVLYSYIDALTKLGEDWEDTINAEWTYGNTRTLETELGEITYHGGIYNDGMVCSSFDDTFHGHEYDGGHEFERLLSVGSTKYVFCGHDHRNTFSFTYKGIRVSYGMSIDYSANGLVPEVVADNQSIFDETIQRGGTLITLGQNSSVTVEQVPFTRNLYRETLAETHMSR